MTRGFYRHLNSADMFIEVIDSTWTETEDAKLVKFRCWNPGCLENAWLLTEKIFEAEIKKIEFKNWKRIGDL